MDGLMMRRHALLAQSAIGKMPLSLTAGAAPMLVQASKKTKVTSCAVSFSPWQEGSGDPSPENIRPVRGWRGVKIHRTGKNLMPNAIPANAIAATMGSGSDAIQSASNARVFAIPIPKNTNIYVQKADTSAHALALGDTGSIAVGTPIYEYTGFTNLAEKAYNTGTHSWLYVQSSSTDIMNELLTTSEFMVSVGTTRQTYEAPYSGETVSVDFGGHTKNLLDPNIKYPAGDFNGVTVSTTNGQEVTLNGTATASGNLVTAQVLPGNAVILSPGTYTSVGAIFQLYSPSGAFITNKQVGTWTIDEPFFVKDVFTQIVSGTTYNRSHYFIALTAGSTPLNEYEPYGTIYGGTVDVVTGDGSNTQKMVVIDGVTNTVRGNGANEYVSNAWFSNATNKKYGVYNIISDKFIAKLNVYGSPYNMRGRENSIGIELQLPPDVAQTSEALNQWFSDNPTQFLYELGTPTPVTVPASAIMLPKGDNYIWAEMIP